MNTQPKRTLLSLIEKKEKLDRKIRLMNTATIDIQLYEKYFSAYVALKYKDMIYIDGVGYTCAMSTNDVLLKLKDEHIKVRTSERMLFDKFNSVSNELDSCRHKLKEREGWFSLATLLIASFMSFGLGCYFGFIF